MTFPLVWCPCCFPTRTRDLRIVVWARLTRHHITLHSSNYSPKGRHMHPFYNSFTLICVCMQVYMPEHSYILVNIWRSEANLKVDSPILHCESCIKLSLPIFMENVFVELSSSRWLTSPTDFFTEIVIFPNEVLGSIIQNSELQTKQNYCLHQNPKPWGLSKP